MKTINLTIIAKTCGDRMATVAVLEMNGYKKALVKCQPGHKFKDAFTEAIEKINQPSIVNVKTNKKSAEVHDLILKENAKGRHFVFLQPPASLEMLEWLTYETALQKGADEVLMEDILKTV